MGPMQECKCFDELRAGRRDKEKEKKTNMKTGSKEISAKSRRKPGKSDGRDKTHKEQT